MTRGVSNQIPYLNIKYMTGFDTPPCREERHYT